MASRCLTWPVLLLGRVSLCHHPLRRLLVVKGWMTKTCSLTVPDLKMETPEVFSPVLILVRADHFVPSIVSPPCNRKTITLIGC
jgi:hypothetical protein